jgi:predicted kinase
VDWLVEMVRFDQDALFDRLASRNALDSALMPSLGTIIAQFHLAADHRRDHGGRPGMAWVIDGNADGFAEQGAGILEPDACTSLTAAARDALERHSARLEARRRDGLVRHCHGDLHLRNIVLLDRRPTLFDGVEFNDEIACIDVLYDLAFLLMDLWRRRLPRHANTVWNAYLAETADFDGVALVPLFLSCRAAVRAKTSATAANLQHNPQRQHELNDAARDYLAFARQLLHPPAACLLAIGGRSGSGKSTLAHALAPTVGPVPGAVVIRSDEIRKRLCGVDALQRLGPEGYTAQVSERVYGTVTDRAARVGRGGHVAIADAVFARPADREGIERAAAMAGVPFIGLWLDAPESELIARSRRRHLDPSDADADVIRRQLVQDIGPIAWHHIDASGTPEDVLKTVSLFLRERLKAGPGRQGSRVA